MRGERRGQGQRDDGGVVDTEVGQVLAQPGTGLRERLRADTEERSASSEQGRAPKSTPAISELKKLQPMPKTPKFMNKNVCIGDLKNLSSYDEIWPDTPAGIGPRRL